MGSSYANLSGLNWSAIVAAAVFVTAQVITLLSKLMTARKERRNLARALLAEIAANHEGLQDFDENLYDKFHESGDLYKILDVVTVTPANKIYETNISKMYLFPTEIIKDIVKLYTKNDALDKGVLLRQTSEFKGLNDDVKQLANSVFVKTLKERTRIVKDVVCKLESYG